MEEVMCLEGERQYFERYLWFYGKSAIIFMYICEERDCYPFLTKITEGGLDNVVQRRDNGSARLGSSIAPFIQCVKLYYIKLSCEIRKQGELCPVFGFFLL